MSLSLSADVAHSGLSSSAQQSAVSARNVARVNEPGASRKIVNLTSIPGAGVRISSIVRAPDDGLREAVLGAGSDLGAQKAVLEGLTTLAQTVGDPNNEQSPSALLGKLSASIQLYASSPHDAASGRAAVAAAHALAKGLNSASQSITSVLQKADADTAAAVANLNDLLPNFQGVNDQIVQGTLFGRDTTDLEDQRDELLKKISSEIGIRTTIRSNNDMVVQTDSGLILFEHRPRAVTFEASPNLAQGQLSNSVYIDGVPVTSQTGGMPVAGGRIAGLAKLANEIVPTYGGQLDEIARGLVATFAESDQSSTPTLPDIPGLFTFAGATGVPAMPAVSRGLAGTLIVNSNVDPDNGGDVRRLRDGGIGDPGITAYVYNSSGAAGFSDRLQSLIAKLNAPQNFDPLTGLNPTATLSAFATDSSSSLEALRKSATSEADYKTIVFDRSSTSLSNATGVNLDEEVTHLLDIERSYQASAKVLGVVNQMLDTLLNTIR